MSERPRTADRSFYHLLVASIIAGYTLQANWAIQHQFDYFSARVFAMALAMSNRATRLTIANPKLRLPERGAFEVLFFLVVIVFPRPGNGLFPMRRRIETFGSTGPEPVV